MLLSYWRMSNANIDLRSLAQVIDSGELFPESAHRFQDLFNFQTLEAFLKS